MTMRASESVFLRNHDVPVQVMASRIANLLVRTADAWVDPRSRYE